MFSGSYHGHFDGTLGKVEQLEQNSITVPAALGVTPNLVADTLVLEYGNPDSLEIIKANQQELAAIIVEPVQNSNLNLQPKEFLQQLRQLTQTSGIALIFDEILTGFRIHLGGAQAWFGIEADIATYGKIVGGGMPIGVIAGKAAYMDRIDGGMWNYGDASSPQVKTTFFAGTYCKHPLAMTAAKAILQYLKIQGNELQLQLNHRTSQLVNTINTYLEADEVPIRLVNCGSIFNSIPIIENSISPEKLKIFENIDLIYYHLINKGVFLRQGGGLLSTAHTEADLEYIIQVVKESIKEMREGGFLPN
jgi:glutamate-1-semialdehyde aminotransferase